MEREKIFTNHLPDKGLISKIDKELIQLNNNKTDNPIKTGTRPEEKFFQSHTNSLQVREKVLDITGQSDVLTIKITMRYYYLLWCPLSKLQLITNAGKEAEKRKPRYTVQFSCSVVSNSLRPHESQHTKPPCPSPSPGVHSTHVHRVSDAIQPSHPRSSPFPPAPNPSQHQSLFQ